MVKRSEKDADVVRLNFLVRPEVKERLVRLRELTEADTMTEVMRRAVLLYETLVSMHGRGERIFVRSRRGDMVELRFMEPIPDRSYPK